MFNVSPTTILQATQTSSVQGHYAQQKLRHTTIHNNRDNKVNWQFSGPVIHNRCHLRHLETSQIPGETWKTIGMQRTEAAETADWEWEGRFVKTWFTKFHDFQNKFLIFLFKILNSMNFQQYYKAFSTKFHDHFNKIPWLFQRTCNSVFPRLTFPVTGYNMGSYPNFQVEYFVKRSESVISHSKLLSSEILCFRTWNTKWKFPGVSEPNHLHFEYRNF